MGNRRLHFKLSWSVVAVALAIVVTGLWVALRSVQITPLDFHFFGMQYSRFLLVMLTGIGLYTAFVTIGIFARKNPRIHRTAMVLASLCLLAGATARMSFLHPVFGATGWIGLLNQSSPSARRCCSSAAPEPTASIAGSRLKNWR